MPTRTPTNPRHPMNPENTNDNREPDSCGHCAPSPGSVSDSRLAYIVCHLASLAKNLAVFGGIVWLAYVLQSGWVLWALLLCPWTRYKHDFGRSLQNAEVARTEGEKTL